MTSEYELSKVGFPIRKSADQSSFAAPHGLSQRITSFIASQRQGIHRMLLRHLIVLMIDVREIQRPPRKSGNHFCDKGCRRKHKTYDQKDHLCLPNVPDSTTADGVGLVARCRMSSSRIHSLFTMTNSSVTIVSDDTNLNTFRIWWSQTGSNRRPEACKATALPTELWPLLG